MPAPLVLGVDSSTQSTKAELRRLEDGAVVASAKAPHPATTPPVSEQDPEMWWQALSNAVSKLGDHRSDVVAMSIAGQQHGLVLLDDQQLPIRPAKLWNDTTSASQAERLVAEFGAATWAQQTGSVPVASFTISKLAWVAEHEPQLFTRATMVMLPHDYLTWRLTGEHVTDRGDASGTGWFDPVQNDYLRSLLDAAVGSTCEIALPRVADSFQPVGSLTTLAASELGLPPGIVVGPGTGDNMAAALGLGLRSGDVALSLGTSGTVFAVSVTPTADSSGAVAGFASASGEYLPLVCTLNATKVTDSICTLLDVDVNTGAKLALTAAREPGSTVLIPYFDGERTPNLPEATGTLLGLTNETTRAQIALAAHDGVLCGLFSGRNTLELAGARVDGRLLLIGGGAKSPAFRQRCADLLNEQVLVPETDETVATGAAVQAAIITDATDPADVAHRWNLGSGIDVAPSIDARERVDLFASHISQMMAQNPQTD
jgi:xylulokinase